MKHFFILYLVPYQEIHQPSSPFFSHTKRSCHGGGCKSFYFKCKDLITLNPLEKLNKHSNKN